MRCLRKKIGNKFARSGDSSEALVWGFSVVVCLVDLERAVFKNWGSFFQEKIETKTRNFCQTRCWSGFVTPTETVQFPNFLDDLGNERVDGVTSPVQLQHQL